MDKISVLTELFDGIIKYLKEAITMIRDFLGGMRIEYGWQSKDPTDAANPEE